MNETCAACGQPFPGDHYQHVDSSQSWEAVSRTPDIVAWICPFVEDHDGRE